MKIILKILVAVSIVCLAFGYWGYYTRKGTAYFDEMSGMIPFFALIVGGALLFVSGIFLFIVKRRKK